MLLILFPVIELALLETYNNCLQLLKSKGDIEEQLADRDQTRDWSLLGILNLRHLDSIHNTKVHKKEQSLIKLLGTPPLLKAGTVIIEVFSLMNCVSFGSAITSSILASCWFHPSPLVPQMDNKMWVPHIDFSQMGHPRLAPMSKMYVGQLCT